MAGLVLLWAAVMGVMAACGEDGDGNDDTIWTGLSGVVVLVIVVWLIVRALRKRG